MTIKAKTLKLVCSSCCLSLSFYFVAPLDSSYDVWGSLLGNDTEFDLELDVGSPSVASLLCGSFCGSMLVAHERKETAVKFI